MERSDSPLHMLAEVACFVRKKEKLLFKIFGRRQCEKSYTVVKRESCVVDGDALNLLLHSFGNPSECVQRKRESPINNVDSEVSDCKRNTKKKIGCDSEAENQEIKKQGNDLNQFVLISELNLEAQSQTKISVSDKIWKLCEVCLNSFTEIVSKDGNLMGFHEDQISKKQSSSEAELKGSEKSWEENHRSTGTNPPTEQRKELPLQFKTKIQEQDGSEVKLVIEKQLHASDVNPSSSRFSIPENQIQNEFLKEAEKNLLDQHVGNGQKLCGLDVLVLGPCLGQFNLQLKKWRMKENIVYNLTREWNKVRSSNGLQEKDWVQLWSFRIRDQLCFALVKLQKCSEDLIYESKGS